MACALDGAVCWIIVDPTVSNRWLAMAQAFFDPCAADSHPAVKPARRLDGVSGKSVGLVDNSKVNADLFLDALAAVLNERFGLAVKKPIRKAAPKDSLKEADF